MVTVSEVVVGLRSEGAEDTKDDLESVNDQTEETTQALDAQSEEMSDLAQSFSGALSAAAVGLAAASAGLLSQVPVLGQVFDGLFAIVQAVALQMDQVLRPVLGPLSKAMFGVAQSISSAEGTAGDLIGVFGSIVAAIGAAISAVGGFVAAAAAIGKGGAAIAALKTAVGIIGGIMSTIAGAISLPAVAVGALVAAIAAAIAIIITDFRGLRTKGIKIIKGLWDTITDKVSSGVQSIKNFGSNMLQAGKDLINELVSGIRNKISEVKDAAKEVAAELRQYLPGSPAETGPLSDLDKTGPGLVDEFAGGITSSLGTIGNAGQQAANAADGRGGGRTLPGSQTTTTQVFLNGRQIGQGTSGERFDESARRGQTF